MENEPIKDIRYQFYDKENKLHTIQKDAFDKYTDDFVEQYPDAELRMKTPEGEIRRVPANDITSAMKDNYTPYSVGYVQPAKEIKQKPINTGNGYTAGGVYDAAAKSIKNYPLPAKNNKFGAGLMQMDSDINNIKNTSVNKPSESTAVDFTKSPQSNANERFNNYIDKAKNDAIRGKETRDAEDYYNRVVKPSVNTYITNAEKQATSKAEGVNVPPQYSPVGTNSIKEVEKSRLLDAGRISDSVSSLINNPKLSDNQKQIIYKKLNDDLVSMNTPKGTIEYILNKAGKSSLVGGLIELANGKTANQMAVEHQAEKNYNPSSASEIAGGTLGFLLDAPVLGGTNFLSGQIGKQIIKSSAKQLVEKAAGKLSVEQAEKIAERSAMQQTRSAVAKRILTQGAQGAAGFVPYTQAQDIINQGLNINAGQQDKFNIGQFARTTAESAVVGAGSGIIGGVVGNASRNLRGIKKVGADALETLGQSTIFGGQYVIDNAVNGQPFDLEGTVKAGMFPIVIKAGHFLNPANIGETLSKFKNSPLSVRDKFINDFSLTETDKNILNGKLGIDTDKYMSTLAELAKGHEEKVPTSMEVSNKLLPDSKQIKDNEVEDKRVWLSDNANRILSDQSVPYELRRKVLYLTYGDVAPEQPVTDINLSKGKDGSVQLQTISYDGNPVDIKNFKTQQEADKYISDSGIDDIADRNKTDFLQKASSQYVLSKATNKAIHDVAASQQVGIDKMADIITRSAAGDKLTAAEKNLIKDVNDKINSDTSYLEETNILQRASSDLGTDIKKILDKPKSQRTPDEQSAVESYRQYLVKSISPEENGRIEQGNVINKPQEPLQTQTEPITAPSAEDIEANRGIIAKRFDAAENALKSVGINPEEVTQENSNPAVQEYLSAKKDFDDYTQHVQNKITEAQNGIDKEVQGEVNPDMNAIVRARVSGEDEAVTVVKGNLATDSEGNIDTANSSDVIYYKTADGKILQATPKLFQGIESVSTPDEESKIRKDAVTSDVVSKEQEEIDNYGLDFPYWSPEQGMQVTDANHSGVGVITGFTPEGRILVLDQNGRTKDFHYQDLRPYEEESSKTSEETPQNEVLPTEQIQQNVSSVQQNEPTTENIQAQPNDGLVRDENGKAVYHLSPIEATLNDMRSKSSDDRILSYSSKQQETALAEAKKLAKQTPKSDDFDEYNREQDEIDAAVKEANDRAAYWKQLSKAIEDENNQTQPVQKEETKPVEAEPTQTVPSIKEEKKDDTNTEKPTTTITEKDEQQKPSKEGKTTAPLEKTESKKEEAVKTVKIKKSRVYKKRTRYVKEDEELGEPQSLREMLLREIATGRITFKWGDSKSSKTKGLGAHLGMKNSKSEMRKRIWALSNDGDYPEVAAERFAGDNEYSFEGTDDTIGIFNEILDIMKSYDRPSEMMKEAKRLHGMDNFEEEEERYFNQYEDTSWECEYIDMVNEERYNLESDSDFISIFVDAAEQEQLLKKYDYGNGQGENEAVHRQILQGEQGGHEGRVSEVVDKGERAGTERRVQDTSATQRSGGEGERRNAVPLNKDDSTSDAGTLPEGKSAGEVKYTPATESGIKAQKEIDSKIEEAKNNLSLARDAYTKQQTKIANGNGLFGDTQYDGTSMFGDTSDFSEANQRKVLEPFQARIDAAQRELDNLISARDGYIMQADGQKEIKETEKEDTVKQLEEQKQQDDSQQIENAAIKVAAEKSAESTGNVFNDSGEKIGGAFKDLGIKHNTREDSEGVPAWRKKYTIATEYPDSNSNRSIKIEEGKFCITYKKERTDWKGDKYVSNEVLRKGYYGEPILFDSKEEAERFIPIREVQSQRFRIYKIDGKFQIVRPASNGKAVKYTEFNTEEEAKVFLASEEGCISLLNHKRENFELPALEKVTRNGKDWREGKHISSSDEFKNKFGFRGVEFGNWINQNERQQFVDYAYDALCDLSDLLGISPNALSLNGELSISFGARGRKGAAAHYEPDRWVINMTKMNGAGSLAHEWAHALDNYFGMMRNNKTIQRQTDGTISNSDEFDFSTNRENNPINRGLRNEVNDAIGEIIKAIKTKQVTAKIEIESAQSDLKKNQHFYDGAKKYILDKITRGVSTYSYNRKTKKYDNVIYKGTDEQIKRVSELLQNVRERKDKEMKATYYDGWEISGNDFKEAMDIVADILHEKRGGKRILYLFGKESGLTDWTYRIIQCDNRLQKAINGDTETVKVDSDFLKNSKWFDSGRASKYFSKPLEMFARSFESFMLDRMMSKGIHDDYLVYSKSPLYLELFGKTPYPTGEERKHLNTLFDNLIKTIQEKTDESTGNSVLYQSSQRRFKPIEKDKWNNLIDRLRKTGLVNDVVTDIDLFNNRLAEIRNAEQQVLMQSGWHGSPYVIRKEGGTPIKGEELGFDFSKIGKGEGAQAYGWGGYVTTVKGIGKMYAESNHKDKDISSALAEWKMDSEIELDVDTRKYFGITEPIFIEDGYSIGDADKNTLINEAEKYYNIKIDRENEDEVESLFDKLFSDMDNYWQEEFDIRKQNFIDSITSSSNLYGVDIPENDGTNYLSWDKPIKSIQFDKIIELLSKEKGDEYSTNFEKNRETTVENIYNQLSAELGDKEASEFLSRCGFVGIEYPAQYQSGGRSDNAKNYVIFKEDDIKVTSWVQYLKDSEGVTYGFVDLDGKIYLNHELMNANTPVHEFGHLWINAIKNNNPELYNRGIKLVAKSNYLDEVKTNDNYKNLSEEEQKCEALASAIGDRGESIENETVKDKILNWIKDLWAYIKNKLGIKSGIEDMTLDDFADNAAKELLSGNDIVNKESDNDIRFRMEDDESLNKDELYKKAVEGGDIDTAIKMLEDEAKAKGYSPNSDYQGSMSFNGSAPSSNDYFETREERKNAFDSGDFEGTYSLGDFVEAGIDNNDLEWQINSNNAYQGEDNERREAILNLRNAVRNGSGTIKIYRAVDAGIKEKSIRNGDWVTPSLSYAKNHIGLQDWEKGRIISETVPIDDIWWNGDDIAEWGYDNGSGEVYKNVPNNRKSLSVTYNDKGNLIPLSKRFDERTNDIRFRMLDGESSDINDKQLINELEKGKKIKVYRAMQIVGGKLYPPMAAVVNGKEVEPIKLGVWEQSDEHPELVKNGKFILNKGKSVVDGKQLGTVAAAYNPYFHTSRSPLNDQFSTAYKRPNLVVVEVEVPESELTSGYKAEGAKDSVGELSWKSGVVSGKLPKEKERKVILTRYDKPLRIVPDSEVADKIAEMLKGENIDIPYNVVTPSLREELAKRGINVVPDENGNNVYRFIGEKGAENADNQSEISFRLNNLSVARKDQIFLSGGDASKADDMSVSPIETRINELSKELNVEPIIIRDESELPISVQKALKRNPGKRLTGWYDTKTDNVFLYLPGIIDENDAEKTMLHEIVSHKGLRGLLGDKFDGSMDDIYKSLPKEERAKIATKMVSNGYDIREATEEYISAMAEQGTDMTLLKRIIAKVREWIKNLGVKLKMSDNDIRYMLFRSRKNLSTPSEIKRDLDVRDKLFRFADDEKAKDSFELDAKSLSKVDLFSQIDIAKSALELSSEENNDFLERLKHQKIFEAYVDKMNPLRVFQETISKIYKQDIPDYCNGFMYENAMASRSKAEMDVFHENYYKPLMKAITKLGEYGKVRDYVYEKHGMERNAYMRDKKVKQYEEAINQSIEKLKAETEAELLDLKNRKNVTQKDIDDVSKANLRRFKKFVDDSEKQLASVRKAQVNKDYAGLEGLQRRLKEVPKGKEIVLDENFINSEIEKFEQEHNEADIQELWKRINDASDFMLDKQRASGCIDKYLYDKIKSMYKYYVPLRDWADPQAEDFFDYFYTDRYDTVNSPIKKANQRQSEAGDPFANIASMAESAIIIGNKNIFKQHVLRLVRNFPTDLAYVSPIWKIQNPETGEWEEVAYNMPVDANGEAVMDSTALQDDIDLFNERMQALSGSGMTRKEYSRLDLGMPIKKWQAQQHQIRVKENGKDMIVYMTGSPRVSQAVNGDNVVRLDGWFFKNRANMMSFMANNFTSRSLNFIYANLTRDLSTASTYNLINNGAGYTAKFIANVPHSAATLFEYLTTGKYNGKYGKYLEEFIANGGETGFTNLKSYNDYKKQVKIDIAKANGNGKVADSFRMIGRGIELLNRQAEDTTRFSQYITARESGLSIPKSVSSAKEISVNFNRKGSGAYGAAYFKNIFMFLNAGIQSNYLLAKTFKNHPAKSAIAFGSWATLGLMVGLLHAMRDGSDTDYFNLSDWIRQNNACFSVEGGKYITVPLALEIRPFWAMGDIIAQKMFGRYKGKDAVTDILTKFSEAAPYNFVESVPRDYHNMGESIFANIATSDAAKPIWDVILNRDFTGRPIFKETDYNEYVPEYKKAFKNTSTILVAGSKMLNKASGGDMATKGALDGTFTNPAVVEYLFNSYLGGVSKQALQFAKLIYNPIMKGDVEVRDVPIVDRFLYNYDGMKSNSNINERYQALVKDLEESQSRDREYEKEFGGKESGEALKGFMDKMTSREEIDFAKIKLYKAFIDELGKQAKDLPDDQSETVYKQIYKLKKQLINDIDSSKKK